MTCKATIGSVTHPAIKWPLFVAVILAVVSSALFHGAEFVNFSLDADEENVIGRANPTAYILLGRWGMALAAELVLPEVIFPITALSIFLFAYGASFALLVSKFDIHNWESVVVAAPLYFGFPTLLYIIAYNTCFSIGLGMLASTVALYMIRTHSTSKSLVASFLLAFAISTYQSVIWFAVVIFLADIFMITSLRTKLQEPLSKMLARYLGTIVFGITLYVAIAYIALFLVSGHITYIDSYIRLDLLSATPANIIQKTASEIVQIYGGVSPNFLGQALYYQLLMAVLISVLAWYLLRLYRIEARRGLIAAGLILGILVSPFLQHPITGGFMPYRALLGIPAAAAAIALFATEVAPIWLRRWVILPLSFLLVIEFSAINNIQYYAGQWRTERDKVLASEIALRLQELAPHRTIYRIAVVGAGPVYNDVVVRPVFTSSLSYSIFEITGGNVRRIANYLRIVSGLNVAPATQKESEQAFQFSSTMPTWPVAGSIAQMNDIFVIKFGEPTASQLISACHNRVSDFCSGRK